MDAGETTYDPGVVCARGHASRRNTWSNKCLRCHADRQNQRSWKAMGIEYPERPKPDACECCGNPPGAKGLALDHDHETGAFRGWLCGPCNTAIGSLGDCTAGVQRALDYLKRGQ